MANRLEPGASPKRVVSLIPSMTDSFLTLGLGRYLVGITDYCPLPESKQDVRRVGGTKDARTDDILALRPDLVIANREENSPLLVEALESAGMKVWVTFPRTVRQALSDLTEIALGYPEEKTLQRVVWLERAVDWLEGARGKAPRTFFCPIWRDGPVSSPDGWMTFNQDTYAHDLLSLCGGENVFAARTDARYPRVTREEISLAAPELVLLPSEPFPFTEDDVDGFLTQFPDLPAVKHMRILRVDGRHVFWHGTRLGESIRVIPEILLSGNLALGCMPDEKV